MELTGVADASITYAIEKYPEEEMNWYCDNKSAVKEIPKLKHRGAREWLAASNTDISEYLADLLRDKLNHITVIWKRGHPEGRQTQEHRGMHNSKISTGPDKMRDIDMLLDGATSIWRARCKEVHDTTNLEEDPKVVAKQERVEALWKDIDDARQCGKPKTEIVATD
jgi:hypothetical protein